MFATSGCSIKLWDAKKYTLLQEIPSGRVDGLTWAQNGQCIASLGESAAEITLYAVNSKSTANIGVVRVVDSPSYIKFPCRSSHYLGVGSKDGTVALWNLKTKSEKKAYTVSSSPISCLAFSHNDSHIVASSKGSIYLLSTMNNNVGGPYKIFDKPVTEVVYSMVKKSLVGCSSEGGSVALFDANANKLLHTFANAHAAPVSSVSFSPINELLMTSVGYDKKFVCYSIQTKKQILTHKSSVPLTSATLLPGCQHIALGAMTGEVFIHDLRVIRKPLVTLQAHNKAVTSVILCPAAKHFSEGASCDPKAANTKPKKRVPSATEISSKSDASTKVSPEETNPPAEVSSEEKPEVSPLPMANPSQEVMSAIFSPVRPAEQLSPANHGRGEELPKFDSVMSQAFSPVRSSPGYLSDAPSSASKDKAALIEDIFSPVRTAPSDDASSNFHDVFSPIRNTTQGSDIPQIITELSCQQSQDELQLNLDSSDRRLSNKSVKFCDEFHQEVPSPKSSQHKENVNPNKLPVVVVTPSKETRNSSSAHPDTPSEKVLCPLQPVNDQKWEINSPARKSFMKYVSEVSEQSPGRRSDSSPAEYSKNQTNSIVSNKLEDSKLTGSLDDKVTKLSDASQKIYEGTKVGSTASHMQVELIRSCMAEVLDDFEDDMNQRMMHLQFVVTKQYLQLKGMMEQLHNLHSLTHGLLTENERLQTENARLKCHF
ncbi:protein NEDD1-like isoform X2 [Macrobrachium nipponense]|uniref:protein NEDD1-like isoform X2 n=1 Tax=Macrobrachium nipponense TaxID=159736 RepID=UPI0030C898C1